MSSLYQLYSVYFVGKVNQFANIYILLKPNHSLMTELVKAEDQGQRFIIQPRLKCGQTKMFKCIFSNFYCYI